MTLFNLNDLVRQHGGWFMDQHRVQFPHRKAKDEFLAALESDMDAQQRLDLIAALELAESDRLVRARREAVADILNILWGESEKAGA